MQIIILGMHRSGTSALSRLLNLMGAYIGPEDEIMPPNPNNPAGYWERVDVVKINDEFLLRSAKATWDRVAEFGHEHIPNETRQEFASRAAGIVSELNEHQPWVVKDPRMCLLLPVWRPLLERPICIHIYRRPSEVAQSLKTRNKFALPFGVALWEKYNREAFAASQDLPRLIVSHGDVLHDPMGLVRRLLRELADHGVSGLHLPDEADVRSFIDENLHNARGSRALDEQLLNQQQMNLLRRMDDGSIFDTAVSREMSAGGLESLHGLEQHRTGIADQNGDMMAVLREIEQSREELRAQLKAVESTRLVLQRQNARLKSEIKTRNNELSRILGSKPYAVGQLLSSCFRRTVPSSLRPVVVRTGWTSYRLLKPVASIPWVLRSTLSRRLQRHYDSGHQAFAPPRFDRRMLASFRVDIVICVHNALEDVRACLHSVQKHRLEQHRLIIVDDGSSSATEQWLRHFMETCAGQNDVLIRHDEAQGYTRAANAGLRASDAEYTILLNSDTIVPEDWVLRLIECGESDPEIGLISPVSNAASWQSVPERSNNAGDWAVNNLPEGLDVNDMARLIELLSGREFTEVSIVNGFCICFKQRVIEELGVFDDDTFPQYGEENDYCLRAGKAGFKIAIAAHAYVYHAKSKSYSHDKRRKLSCVAQQSLVTRHTREAVDHAVRTLRENETLQRLRGRLRCFLDPKNRCLFSVLFLLPVRPGGGGVHSVVQEAMGLRDLGINAQIAVPAKYDAEYLFHYKSCSEFEDLFIFYDGHKEISRTIGEADIAIATIYTSVAMLQTAMQTFSNVIPAYYIQDYEPFFHNKLDPIRQQAISSYTAIPEMILFAKTRWLCDQVEARHNVHVHKITPSIDHAVYYPSAEQARSGLPVRIAAMVRVRTPRRGPMRTLRVLERIKQKWGDRVHIDIFGTNDEDLAAYHDTANEAVTNHGMLSREGVADLLRAADIFVDFSDYQAFGRTALEAMACGCAVIVPKEGGTVEYARHRENALVVDTSSEDVCYEALDELSKCSALREQCQKKGLQTAAEYSIDKAAMSEAILLQSAWMMSSPHKQMRRSVMR